MDYRYIKAFILTAKYSSFSQTARELKIAQSAVSRQIKLLEESLGEELIIRSSKKVLLTPKGRELFHLAQNFDQMATSVFTKEDHHPLCIGVLDGLLESWFNSILIAFYKKHHRNISIHVDVPPKLKKGLTEGSFDLVFTTENIQNELISSLKLFDERLVLISKEEVNRKHLENHRWIVFSEEDNIFKLQKVASKNIITVDSIPTIINLVKNGVGIAVVPDHTLKKSDNFKIYELPELSKSEIYMATHNYKVLPVHVAEMASMVLK